MSHFRLLCLPMSHKKDICLYGFNDGQSLKQAKHINSNVSAHAMIIGLLCVL